MSRNLMLCLVLVLCSSEAHTAEPVFEPDVTYASPDKTDLKLDFVRPAGDGPFPLIVAIHGGGWRIGSRTEYKDFQKHMATIGYATAAVQYRLTPKHRFPAPLEDVTNAIKFLAANKTKYHIDPKRVGLMGGSAGGHLALLTGFQEAKEFQVLVIVNVCGPTDLRTFKSTILGDASLKFGVQRNSSELLEDLLGTADRKAEIYAKASPITQIRKNGPFVLTLHGTDDDLVPIFQADSLHEALKKAGVKERLIRVPGGNHDFAKWPEQERTSSLLLAIEMFKEYLKPGS
jgi:acetyl esterase/lipase